MTETPEIHKGEFVCLVGRNGAGKTTLLKKLAKIPYHSSLPAIVFTEMPKLENTTVFELVSYGRIPYLNVFAKIRQEDIDAVNRAIKTVGIEGLRDREISRMSDGERQKAMIARALAQERDLILLDEPSAFLDYPSKHELMRLLADLAHNEKKSIILATHDIELVKTYADTIWHIKGGELSVCKSVATFDHSSL